MIWKNKGHEFDEMYEHIRRIKKVYLFGAGHDSMLVKQVLERRYPIVEILGFADNDPCKRGKKHLGFPVYAPTELCADGETGVVISFASTIQSEIDRQLTELGWEKNVNYWNWEDFICVVAAYSFNQLFFPTLSVLPLTACNLNCRDCMNYTPYIRHPEVRSLADMKEDLDFLFSRVDAIGMLHITGGEPLLYPEITELLVYLHEHYGNRIENLETVTNGTIRPKQTYLEELRKGTFRVQVDDYRTQLPDMRESIDENIKLLQQYRCPDKDNVFVMNYKTWYSMFPHKQPKLDESQLREKFDRCHVPFQNYEHKRIYSCNYAKFAQRAGIIEGDDNREIYDLSLCSRDNIKEVMEFRRGYSEKGFTEFCRICDGFLAINQHPVIPAIQMERTGRT